MTIIILPPPAEMYLIDTSTLDELVLAASPDLEERPDAWTRATVAIVRPGLELMLSGLRQALFNGSPLARFAAVRILTCIADGQEPSGTRRPHLRAMIAGYRLAIKTRTGQAVSRLFASNILAGLD